MQTEETELGPRFISVVNELEDNGEESKQGPTYSKRDWNTEPKLYSTTVQIYTITRAIKQQT